MVIVIAVVIGMGVAWNFSTDVLNFIEKPLTGKTYLTDVKKKVYAQVKDWSPALYTRYKLEQEINAPVKKHPLNYSAPLEPFFIQCKISMLAGFIMVLPIVFHQLWLFIAPGLTRKERRLVIPFITAATVTFCVGAMFFLIVIWPVIINFSLSYEAEGLQSWFNISAYVNFCLRLILVFGLIFELPVLTLLLARFGIVSYDIPGPQAQVRPAGQLHHRRLPCRPDHHVRHHGPALPDVRGQRLDGPDLRQETSRRRTGTPAT